MAMNNNDDIPARRSDADARYEVGDKRPPRHSQFKPGQTGNPRGRPKGSVNLRTRVSKELRKSVTVTSGGRSTRWVKADLVAMQIVDAAAKGDLKAAVLAMRLDDELGALAVSSSAVAAIPRLDKDALKRIAARAQRLAEDA